jgi:transitional endoplasmic reticulum ATPase
MGRRLHLNTGAGFITGGLVHALQCADHVAASVDRRRPEARALASWLDDDRAGIGLSDGENFCPAAAGRCPLPAAAWRRVRTAITRTFRIAAVDPDAPAERWLAVLNARLGLDALEQRLLALALFYAMDERLEHLVDQVSTARGGPSRLHCNANFLALLVADTPGAVELALSPDGRLLGSGLLRVDNEGDLDLLWQITSLIRRSISPQADPFAQLLGASIPASLAPEAFAHLGQQAEIAAALLRASVVGGEPGVNILLYGPPGTGKTSFAATLAAQVGARLRPITEHDRIGAEPNRSERLSGLQLAQRLAPVGETVLLFDEAEDVFTRSSFADGEPVTTSRVFMHRLLERTPVPVIWTANDITVLGPAVLRRMTLCLEMKIPGLAVRTRLWRDLGRAEGVPLTDTDAARLARLVPAAPAVAATALRATRLAGGDAHTTHVIVEGIARAVAGGRPLVPAAGRPALYDPALVNADTDLQALADTLSRRGAPRAVSLLLSGPPGTGKSAWARHLAGRMGMEVLEKRASDLLGPYVGQTEAAIASAFAEARETGAFLIFDEADSLLGDRTGAVRSWEVSQVNEMLTWMEQHPLPFACTTNLPERLDPASLRRFLVKATFKWLTVEQARLAWLQFFGGEPPAALKALRTLTPADFALVKRRIKLLDSEPLATTILKLMSHESEDRVPCLRHVVGFRSNGADD